MLTPTDVEVAVKAASTLEIANALSLYRTHTGIIGLARDDNGRLYFRCPFCQHPRDLIASTPHAFVVDAVRWRCPTCNIISTRWVLERALLEDAELLDLWLDVRCA